MIYSEVFSVLFTIAVFEIYLAKGEPKRCSFEVQRVELGKMPLAYTTDKNRKPFIIYPDADGHFNINNSKKIVLSCVTTTFQLAEISSFQDIEVTCFKGTEFRYNRKIYNYSDFICQDFLRSESRKSDKKCQPNNNDVIDVGYRAGGNFFPVYSVCFDETTLSTLYTWYRVRSPYIDQVQNYERPGFFVDSIFERFNMRDAYTKHRKTINKMLNLDANSKQYFDIKDHYLAKAHFIPRTDLYYAREQAATFTYLNISPQWNKCNVTWREVEMAIRTEMKKYPDHKYVIVTGVYGVYTLPDSRRRNQPLYLISNNQQQLLPVPKFVWKMMYDVDNPQNSVVLISYNNRTSAAEENVPHDIDCHIRHCPGDITNLYAVQWMGATVIYCCDIVSFQEKYGTFDNDVFSVGPNAVPIA